jgi:hypothetical protein
MKEFSKIDFLRTLGLIRGLYNKESGKFDKKLIFYIESYLRFYLIVIGLSKLFLCLFFDKEDKIQFFIGKLIFLIH